ncbi:hypothetical protein NPS01_08740 [Nocardioides psychrotolerans]|nr:hypothetical protein NPS01_08740 [Nocardioides psychrotolerans]
MFMIPMATAMAAPPRSPREVAAVVDVTVRAYVGIVPARASMCEVVGSAPPHAIASGQNA